MLNRHRDRPIIERICGESNMRNDVNRGTSSSLFPHFCSPRRAFTLSEILITLGIIGVLAAMTIPNLISSYQKEQTVVQLKKAYSTINQTLNDAAADQSVSLSYLFEYDNGEFTTASMKTITTNFVQTNIIPYVKVSRDCGYIRGGGCVLVRKSMDGTIKDSSSNYLVYLSDGTSLSFFPNNDGTKWRDMIIQVDINGNKPPNMFGKDSFEMIFTKYASRVVFFGQGSSRTDLKTHGTWGCNKNSNGDYCGALIMTDGWQLADDYPW